MKRTIALLIVAAFAFACGEKNDHDHDDDHDHDHGTHMDETATEIDEAMASLGAEDRALALAQKTCPVSGEPLGSMGTPLKMTVGDEAVFLCCKGCVKRFNKEPQKYLEQVKK